MFFEGETSATKTESSIVSETNLSEAVNINGLSLCWQDLSVIARSDTLGFEESTKLSQQYKLKDWLKLNSLFSANQLFFEPVIAPVSELGTVAVIDDSFGQLSLSLGLKGARVLHVALDSCEKDYCEQLFSQNGLEKIRVLCFDSTELEQVKCSTLLLGRPAPKYKHSAERLGFILNTLVSQAETVVVVEENKFSLRRLVNSRCKSLSQISMFSPYWWTRTLSGKHASTDIYGVLNGSTSIQVPRISLWAKGQLESDKAHQSIFKRVLSTLPFFKVLLPGFMVVSSSSPGLSWFERVLDLESVKAAMPGLENGYIKRVFAGNRGVTVIIYGNQRKNCVWRIASESEGVERVNINAQALQDLSSVGDDKSSIIPSLLYLGKELGCVFSIEEMLPGNDRKSRDGDETARTWMNALQLSMKVKGDYGVDRHAEIVASSIKRLTAFCDSEASTVVERVDQVIKDQFRGRQIDFVPLHGDLKEGNFLYGNNEKLSAVIDWDMYSKTNFPLVDHVIQLIYQNIRSYHDDGVSIFSAFVDKYLKGDFSAPLMKAAKEFSLSERDVRVIVLFSLVRVIDLQFVDALKTHRDCFNSMLSSLSTILEHIEQC